MPGKTGKIHWYKFRRKARIFGIKVPGILKDLNEIYYQLDHKKHTEDGIAAIQSFFSQDYPGFLSG